MQHPTHKNSSRLGTVERLSFFHWQRHAIVYNKNVQTNFNFMYSVECPYAPEENQMCMDEFDAMGICLDLAQEFGYACVRDAFGNMHGDYGNVLQAVEDGVI